MSDQSQQNPMFSPEQIDTFAGFFNTLQKIHRRLIASGYTIEDGKLIPPASKPAKIS